MADDVASSAARANALLQRHVRLQNLMPVEQDELRQILGDAVLQGWLSEALLDDLVEQVFELFEPGRVPIRIVPAEPATEGEA